MFKKVERQFYVESLALPLERQFPKDFVYSGECHNFIEMVYVESGNVEVVENEKVYLMGSGDIIFHAPMEFHRIKSDKDTSPKVYNLSAIIHGKVPDNLYDGIFGLVMSERAEFLRIFKTAHSFICESKDVYCGQESIDALSQFIIRICRNANINNKL